MQKHLFAIIGVSAALLIGATGCEEFKAAFKEAINEDVNASDNPNDPTYKARYIIGVFSIVKYPRASILEQEIECFDRSTIWINTNQSFSSKNIMDVKVVPRPGNPDICDLQFRIDRRGYVAWQIMAGNYTREPMALVIDGICFGTFAPEPLKEENNTSDEWVTVRVGINPVTAKMTAKYAPKNYIFYNPSTSSWF
ncbi:MAG: hypothetical protein PHI35_03000 [Victivallaceae bacterium]|nr:hypothetical protein [Victivallaceae bacterium]